MSDVVSMHCPKCGRKLKIKDRSLFGRKVKCPDCKQSFVLVDPDGPEIPSGEIPASPPSGQSPEKQPPSSLKQTVQFPTFESPTDLVPPANPFDFAPPPPPKEPPFGFPPAPPASAPQPPKFGPFAENPFTASVEESDNPFASPPPRQTAAPAAFTPPAPSAAPASPIPPPSMGGLPTNEESPYALPGRRRKSRRSGNWIGLAAGVVVFAVAIGGIGYVLSNQPVPKPVAVSTEQTGTSAESIVPVVAPEGAFSKLSLENDPKLVNNFLPTQGEPIQLLMMPSGVNLVIHLRPALLWSDDYIYRVFRASLTDDVTNWLAGQIKTYCRRDPQQIEEVVFGIIFGARGMDPQVCTVVHLKEPERLSSLISEFPGRYLFDIAEKPDVRIKVDDKHGVLIHDERTFAICPAELAEELEFWIKRPNHEVSEGIAEQLRQTDRQRLFTAIGTMGDLEIHLKKLVPEPARPLVSTMLEWIGADVETIGWSLHPEPYLHSQVFLQSIPAKHPGGLQQEFTANLQKMPEQVWKDLCVKMTPAEVRFRKLIGRLPAMLQAFQESTISQRDGRLITLTTVLPAKAAPNLALATLFTVNEASRTNFNKDRPVIAASDKPKLPPTIAGRIELPVDAEFNRTPLEPTLQFLCDEIQVKLFVDGDALKDAGYTKNMPQTFTLGKVPMKQALSHVINSYQERDKEMVACFDDEKMLITVTTRKFAVRDGLKISLPAGD